MRIEQAALALVVVLLAGCGGTTAGKEEAKEAVVSPVQVATATREPIERTVEAEAILFPVNQANVTAKIGAPVRRFSVNRGDHVKQGQLLAELENRDLAAAAAEARSNYEQVAATYRTITAGTMPEELTKAQTDVQTAKQTLETAQRLYENRVKLQQEGALAQKLVDDAKVALVQAQSQFETAQRHLQSVQSVNRVEEVKGAQAQLDAAKARYQSALAQVSYSEVRSPIYGLVSDRPLYPGEMATAGAPIIAVIDVSQVVARANVPVKEASGLRLGKTAVISPGDITGKVTVISPAVNLNTTTVEVWIQAPNPGERLKPGTTVHVSINADTIPDAVVVPSAAILSSDEGGEKVMVVGRDGAAHERKVEVGIRTPEKAQIVKGLNGGEQVITVGALGLEDKTKVKVVKPGAEEKDDAKDEKK